MKKTIKRYVAAIPAFSVSIALAFAGCFGCSPKPREGHSHSYTETVVDPTWTEQGYTKYSCTCGESFNDDFVAALGHTPAAAVRENEVSATCAVDGAYDEVVYCAVCDDKLSSEHKTIPSLAHTPGTAVYENVVRATCSAEGSYDSVVYCSVCSNRLSTKHKTIDKTAHTFVGGVCSACGAPERYNIEDLQFTLSQDGNSYAVSGYNGEPTDTFIPSEYLGKPVTAIADNAFRSCASLTRVIIPGTVTSIGGYAFRDCTNLSSLTLNRGLISIGDSAFKNCRGLTSLVIPDGVTTITGYAFEGCNALTSVTIPNSITSIGSYAFSICTKISSVYYAGSVAEFCGTYGIGDLMGYSKDKRLFIDGEEIIDLVIPDSVTAVRREAFYGCGAIKTITIGAGVTTIGDYAFGECASLETVYWNAINCVGGWYSEGVTTVSVADIFQGSNKMTTVVVGDGVRTIPAYAFYLNKSLTKINIPDSVTTIGNEAFSNCKGSKSITIGAGVTTIGKLVFDNCTALETVYWNAINCGDSGYWISSSVYRIFYLCDNLKTLVIGDGVKGIPAYLCYKCAGLETVIVPASLSYVEYKAFADCPALQAVFYLGGDDDYFVWYDGNAEFMNVVHYYSEENPDDGGLYWHYDEDGNPVAW